MQFILANALTWSALRHVGVRSLWPAPEKLQQLDPSQACDSSGSCPSHGTCGESLMGIPRTLGRFWTSPRSELSDFLRYGVAKLHANASAEEHMDPESLGVAQPIILGLHLGEHDLALFRMPQE